MTTTGQAPPSHFADVTVVIATFNRAQYLPEALKSIIGQDLPPRRIVVVADGCTDNTASVVSAMAPRVEIVSIPNGGKARAINHVLPGIDTKYCWFFDDDDAAYSCALRSLISAIEAKPNAGFSFGGWDVVETPGSLFDAPHRSVPYAFVDEDMQSQRWRLFRECTVMMTGSLLRTEAVRAVGGLNEELARGQDYDLMVRLAANFPFTYCNRIVYAWRQHKGSRGPKEESHAANDRLKVWARSAEPVAYYLRTSLPLEAWSRDPDQINSKSVRRCAHVRRSWALAPKQPISFTIEDLLSAFSTDAASDLSQEEAQLLTESLAHDFVGYRKLHQIWRLSRLPRGSSVSAALHCLARGLWWLQLGENELAVRTRLCAACAYLMLLSHTKRLTTGRKS